MSRILFCLSFSIAALLIQPAPSVAMGHGHQGGHQGESQGYKIDTVVTGLDSPWGMAFLPNGDMLVTELSGRLRLVTDGALSPTPVAEFDVVYAGQGGLFDVVLHPDFATNKLVYLSYATGSVGENAVKLVRGRFTGTTLENIETVFVADWRSRPVHYGGRFVFLNDGTIVLTLGDSFDEREKAQDLSNHTGSIVRLTDTGGVPADNPFIGIENTRPEIYSYGHRNPQAIVYDKINDIIYANEHGPRGGDELNKIAAGKNYGWPAITYGVNYSGARVSPYTELPDMEQPLTYWVPSIAPSGMTLYRGRAFPDWDGDIFITGLVFNRAYRLTLDEGVVVGQTELFAELEARLRDIRTGPDGYLYILAEENDDTDDEGGGGGKMYRVTPQ